MKYAVIFDMDGVLVDSTKYIWDSFNGLLKRHNVHFKEKEIKEQLGLSLRDQLKIWKEKYGIGLDLKQFSKKAGNLQLKLIEENVKVNPELLELLNELKKNNVPMGVATSSLKWRAKKILKLLKLDDYFLEVIAADDVAEHKPNPHLFLMAAKRLNVHPKCCVVIEDAANGIEAAKRGHMKSIGHLTRYNAKAELRKADLIIKNFSELSYQRIKKLFA